MNQYQSTKINTVFLSLARMCLCLIGSGQFKIIGSFENENEYWELSRYSIKRRGDEPNPAENVWEPLHYMKRERPKYSADLIR